VTLDTTTGTDFRRRLESVVGAGRVGERVRLAPFTTFKVGGPAEWFVELHAQGELAPAVEVARRAGVRVTVLGGGSNVVVADRGVRGLVIRLRGGAIERVATDAVRADAGTTINGLVRWTIGRGLAGLEHWAGTPGTVGGAVYGNAHFMGRLIGERVRGAGVLAPDGSVARLTRSDLAFGYDDSRLQHSGELLLWADFRVETGDPVLLRESARAALHYRKRTQPLALPSAGCVFRNPDPAHAALPPGVPPSAGALIDRAGLKGFRVGGAQVSSAHANFIVNVGNATASEIRAVIERCRSEVEDRFGIELKDEVIFIGEF